MTLWVILMKEPVCRGGKQQIARGMEQVVDLEVL
jgi:hypothetical protein